MGIAYKRQVRMPVMYKGKVTGEGRIDLVAADRVMLEIKSCDGITSVHRAQLICDLRVTGVPVGLLIDFNVAILKDGMKRVILTR